MDATLALAAVVAVVAAVRSTWSPCGVSMLSTITPVTEASRDRSYPVTVAWFLVGAVVGGITLGLGAAVAAALVGGLDLPTTTALGTLAALAVLAAAFDARILGLDLPGHGRQVNETWLTRFRSWVYGGGFGWQIGVGLATYIVTAGVYLTVAAAALTGRPLVAAALGTLFGLTRGLAIFAGARLTTHEALYDFHRRFEDRRELSRQVTIGAQLLVAAVAAGLAWGPSGLAATVAAGVVVLALVQPEVMRVRSTARGVTTPVEITDRPATVLVDERAASFSAGR
ncbi:hypothetical protein [Actinomarinicola tropica]|uniref:Cytochrome C biogenesis protein transmembrane domain-containing protein n=1 Tax=Actinomarinicola tropica TaxID=2789776 RepID=A0A5Q2RKC5_9ACTN|nr:hypothetical protein [Actinomarinicola tropica]QGG93655.1 hypothetical protein GH723_00190 [Actinomarinicola tropica]